MDEILNDKTEVSDTNDPAPKTSNVEMFFDEDGQLSFFDPQDNYFPVASDYSKIPNRFIEKYGNISYMANLGMMMGITRIEERHKSAYVGTAEGAFYEYVKDKTGTDYSDGLVAAFPVAEFIKVFSINRGGKTYRRVDELWNGEALRNQWQILYEDDKIVGGTQVLIGTMYDKETNTMYMKFNNDLKDVLVNIKGKYANISFPVLGKLKDEFLTTIYELFKKHLDYETQRNKKYGLYESPEVTFNIGIEQFYFLIGLFPVDVTSSDKTMQTVVQLLRIRDYKAAARTLLDSDIIKRKDEEQKTAVETALRSFGYFKKHYLDRAFRKINGFAMPAKLDNPNHPKFKESYDEYLTNCLQVHPTDIHFRYELLKKGSGGKVDSLIFYISKAEIAKEKADTSKKKNAEAELLSPDQLDLIDRIRSIIPEKLATIDLVSIAKTAEWDIGRIDKACRVATAYAKTTTINNLVSFLKKAIAEKWECPVEMTEEYEEQYPIDMVRKTCGFEDFHLMHPEYDRIAESFLNIIYDTLNSDATKIKIGQSYFPAAMVKERLLGLNAFALDHAVNSFLKTNGDNPIISPNYILTILYNAETQDNLRVSRKYEQDRTGNNMTEDKKETENDGTRDISFFEKLEKKKLGKK